MLTPSLQERIAQINREEVVIVPYDPDWPKLFQQEKAHLQACLPQDVIKRIEHYGSTSVPGLSAKPIVDMLIEVSTLDAAKERIVPILEAQGYDYFWRPTHGDDGEPFYCWFIKRNAHGQRTHHLHMIEGHFAEHWDTLLFRDYLIAHPEVCQRYESLKQQLALSFTTDRAAYTQGKADFIRSVMQVCCPHPPPS